MRKPNANQRIKKAMRDNERDVLRHVKKLTKDGKGYAPFLAGPAWRNALERLVERRVVRWSKRRDGYVAAPAR